MATPEGTVEEMPPPPAPLSAKAKGKQKANNDSEPNDLAASKRKRLACEICRIRRVKCEWQESNTCLACLKGDYECPGEPTRKKRAKKGEIQPDESMLALERQFRAFDIGGAATFQMIERAFRHAPPTLPGLPTGWYKQYVRTCAGASKEREIAAEVLCAALVAGSSTFTDHAKILGSISPDMPVATPTGCRFNYSSLVPFGAARAEAVLALSFQSRQIFEDSTMRHRPSPESIYSLIVMDWMANLTREGAHGEKVGEEVNLETEYADVAFRSYRTLMMGRRSELKEQDLELLLGPVNAHLFSLDAHNAVKTHGKPTFRDIDLSPLFPLVSQASATPLVDYTFLRADQDCRQELGKQLLPLVYNTALLYRQLLGVPVNLCDSLQLLEPIWSQIDMSLSNLALLDSSFPSILSDIDSLNIQFDLEGIVQTQQLHLAQLDLLVHQKIVQAFVSTSETTTPPSPGLLRNYATSRSRVQAVFRLVTGFARTAIETSSWSRAREVIETLAVSSAWKTLGKTREAAIGIEMVTELGISLEMGQVLEQCLALASWSSPSAASQREGVLLSLAFTYGALPQNNHPAPPTTLPPPPKPLPPVTAGSSRLSLDASRFKDENFKLDLSFLDDFAREHGIPIDEESVPSSDLQNELDDLQYYEPIAACVEGPTDQVRPTDPLGETSSQGSVDFDFIFSHEAALHHEPAFDASLAFGQDDFTSLPSHESMYIDPSKLS